MLTWIDHAKDSQDRIAKVRETQPDYDEPYLEGVNFRSDDFSFRVALEDLNVPPEQRTWVVWDMRRVPQPWGSLDPREKAGVPVRVVAGIKEPRTAFVLAEAAHTSQAVRMVLALADLGKRFLREAQHALEQAKSLT